MSQILRSRSGAPVPNHLTTDNGKVKDAILAARDRGVYFDVGHGMGSFSWRTARAMMAAGFPPDTISSDVHAFCIDGPAYDQVTTLSKFLALGMPLAEVIAASTSKAAEVLMRHELGTLSDGAVGDATILALEEGSFDFEDVLGQIATGTQRLTSKGVVVDGEWWHPA